MNLKSAVQELSAEQLGQVTGGTPGALAVQQIAGTQLQGKLALRILAETSERSSQIVQKITS
jgi:hypothetical protein